ncbi:hypothetical protein PGB28_14290 [Primorskyibacter aestuariivivens]|uniref:hypothetical protein n=1 Tax=Primorskyibacter aestuariivivens TaxID=1888912 RepID=UPI00230178EA|nr:hypothetical protein [Primorskyibacter aestuariivivens]MDA7429636.1 hypothetical protein [Primorskyibacter aestuariivivens]
MIEREVRILGFLLRHWLAVLGAALIGVVMAAVISEMSVARYKTSTELFIRYGNEYTVPSSVDNYRQQVDVDFDIAMNGEIQILLSWPLIRDALEATPHPETAGALEPVIAKLSASHVPNSPVIKVDVVDADRNWSGAFLASLIEAFQTRRTALFSSTHSDAFLAQRIAEITAELEDTRNALQEARKAMLEVTDRAGSDGVGDDTRSAAERIGSSRRLVTDLTAREATLSVLLEEMRAQQVNLGLLSGSVGRIEILSPPLAGFTPVGPGRTALMILFGLAFGFAAAALAMIVETSRARS